MMMLAACDDDVDDGAGNGGILRFCLLATDMAGRERARGCVWGVWAWPGDSQNLDKCVHIFMRVSRLAISVEYEK